MNTINDQESLPTTCRPEPSDAALIAGKGTLVTGEDDPFRPEMQYIYRWLCQELRDLSIGQTIALPIQEFPQVAKIKSVMHGVVKRLDWKAIEYDNTWKTHLITIKDMKVYIHRLG